MVKEAASFAEEDKKQRERVEAKNGLEQYAYSVQQSLDEENFKKVVSEPDANKIKEKCKEILSWVESNQQADKASYDAKRKELEGIVNPIFQSAASAAGGAPGGGAGGFPGGAGGFPGGAGGFPGGGPGGYQGAPTSEPTVEDPDVD